MPAWHILSMASALWRKNGRAGHAEEAVKAAQEELIGSMTANVVALVMGMVVETRLARELPGLPPDGLPMLDDEWHETGDPQSPKKFCELAPKNRMALAHPAPRVCPCR